MSKKENEDERQKTIMGMEFLSNKFIRTDFAMPIDLTKREEDARKPKVHQLEAIECLEEYYDFESPRGKQNGLLVMPTGSGKTFTVVYWLLHNAVSKGYKVLWLVHRQELINQTNNTVRQLSPLLKKYGFKKLKIIPVSGSREHYSVSQATKYDIVICGIQSAANKNGLRHLKSVIGKQGLDKLLVVIDEAHHAVSPSYEAVLKKIDLVNPNRILFGITATPYRMSEYELAELYAIFNVDSNKSRKIGTAKGFVYEVSMHDLILKNILAKPRYTPVKTEIKGEVEFKFTEEDEKYILRFKELSEDIKTQIANSDARNKIIVDEYKNKETKYGKTLVFAVNQEHAVKLALAFKAASVSCDYCISNEPESIKAIEAFKNNEFKVLINVQMLTEGSDIPDIQSVFLTRPTHSDGLLMQMIGRAMRGTAVGGTEYAYIVDFHDTWDRFNIWLNPKDILDPQLPLDWIIDIGQENKNNADGTKLTEVDQGLIEQIPVEPTIEIQPEGDEGISYDDLYLRIYGSMRFNIKSEEKQEIIPAGWYKVLDENGNSDIILVFNQQKKGYDDIAQDIESIKKHKYADVEMAIRNIMKYFDIEEGLPSTSDIKMFLNTISQLDHMPEYFTFEHQKALEPLHILKQMQGLDKNEEESVYWLEKQYNESSAIKSIYKSFFLFRTSVLNANQILDKPQEVESIDEREEFDIQIGYYDLDKLYEKVITSDLVKEKFSELNTPPISWSNRPLRSRYGACKRWPGENKEQQYSISINKLLCSPKVPEEVIKYVIYHELLHANELWNHNEEFRKQEWKYPDSEVYDEFLDKLFIDYQIDEIVPPRRNAADQIILKQTQNELKLKTTMQSIKNDLNLQPFTKEVEIAEYLKKIYDKNDYIKKEFDIFFKFKQSVLQHAKVNK